MELTKSFNFNKDNKKLEIEVFWGERYDLFINKLKVDDKEFNLRINKCQLMKSDKYGNLLKIEKNIKNKEAENLFKELKGIELQEEYFFLRIPQYLRTSLDQYIYECYLMKHDKNNKIDAVLEEERKIFKLAKKSGKKQELRNWIEPCNDPNEECNFDFVCEYAMPDGTIKKERYHSF